MDHARPEMARYIPITGDMREAVLQNLRESFFADEPLNKAVGLCERGQPHPALERLCEATMADGLSVAVVEEGEVLGVALNGILHRGDIEQSIEKIQHSSDDKFNKIFTVLYTTSQELHLFSTFNVDKILECRIISVSDKARGRGLAKELMRKSIEIAKENGFKLFKVDATGAYSQRICSSLGLRTLRQVFYSEYCGDDGTPVFSVDPPHDALSVMVLELS